MSTPDELPDGAGDTGVHGSVEMLFTVPPIRLYEIEVIGEPTPFAMVMLYSQHVVSSEPRMSESHFEPQGGRSKHTLSHTCRRPFTKMPKRMQMRAFTGGVSVNTSVCVLAPTGMLIVGGATVPWKDSNQAVIAEPLVFVTESETLYVQLPAASVPVLVIDFGWMSRESQSLLWPPHGGRSKHTLSHTVLMPPAKTPKPSKKP